MKTKISRITSLVCSLFMALVMLLTVLVLTMSDVQAASCTDDVLRVKKGASGAADGCSWDDAFPDLQLALAAAESGDQIWVASGVYTPGLMVTDTFEVPSAVKVYGGFVGNETELDQRDWQANVTVLSGDIDGDDVVDENGVVLTTTNIMGDNSYHVLLFDGTSAPITETTYLNGFSITAGDYHGFDNGGGGMLCNGNGVGSDCSPTLINITFRGSLSSQLGGAMFINGDDGGNSNPSLMNVLFSHNSADHGGGGMNNRDGSPMLTDVIFISNTTSGFGGGMANQSGLPVLINVRFESNTAAGGGGMVDVGGRPVLTDVTFISNTASYDGGGMFVDEYSYPKLYDVEFINNYALRYGGGMFNNYDGFPTLDHVVFLENSADSHGGGLYNYFSNAIITDTIFIGNSTDSYGGGLYNLGNNLTLRNSVFLGNDALYGGAIVNYGNELTITNVLIGGNFAERDAGGVLNYGGGSVELNNVTVSGNFAERDGGGVVNYNGVSVKLNNVTVGGNVAEHLGGGMLSDRDSNISVNNSIFENNQDSSGIGTITATSTVSDNSVVTLTNSLIQGSGGSDNWLALSHVDGGDNIDSDPLFIEPIDLSAVPTTTGNLRLQFGSPAIDTGRNDLVPNGVAEDLDGKPRIINSIVDMGAYETNLFYTLTVQAEGAGVVASIPTGIDCGVTCTAVFEENEVVTLTAVADTNAIFTGWSGGGCADVADCVLTMTESQVVTAAFKPNYTVYLPIIVRDD